MEHWLITHEALLRSSCFVGLLVIMLFWEWVAPKRVYHLPRITRWLNNLSIVIINNLIIRIIRPAALVGVALLVRKQSFGLFYWLSLPAVISLPVSIVLLDLAIYWQHRIFHSVGVLWRMHRMHHTDMDLDTTTGIRFHPFEIIISTVYKSLLILLFGIGPAAVILFEIILNATSLFNHGNVRIYAKLEKWLRFIIVTPDMHQIHHSVKPFETNSNYGFNFSFWDRIFKSYRQDPQGGQQGLTIGINTFRDRKTVMWLSGLLITPFLRQVGDYLRKD